MGGRSKYQFPALSDVGADAGDVKSYKWTNQERGDGNPRGVG